MRKFILLLLLNCSLLSFSIGQQTIGLFQNDSLAVNGYTLWTPNKSTYLIDNCGLLVNKWDSEYNAGLAAYLLENGNLLRPAKIEGNFSNGGTGGRLEEFDWDGNLVWTYDVATETYQQHHDIEPMPNGNVLVIAWELKTAEEASEAGAINPVTYWSEMIVEIKKEGANAGAIVWEWHLWDHLIQEVDATKINYGEVAEHPELLNINFRPPSNNDWVHFNSIHYDAFRDEIILSSRFMDEVYIIDHSTTTEEAASHIGGNKGKGGDFLYRWGNPVSYNMGDETDQQLFGQHDARVIPEGYLDAGNITVFNNGAGRPDGNYSSIDMISPPRDDNGNYVLLTGEKFAPKNFEWQYIANPPGFLLSNNRSSAQRLPNGNTMICESTTEHFFEVTRDGQIVWDYQNTAGINGPLIQGEISNNAFIFKAIKYPEDYPAFEGKNLNATTPIEQDPLPSDCVLYTTDNSTGICLLEGVKFSVNLTEQLIYIENTSQTNLNMKLIDISGRLVDYFIAEIGDSTIDIAHLSKGMYVLYTKEEESGNYFSDKFVKL